MSYPATKMLYHRMGELGGQVYRKGHLHLQLSQVFPLCGRDDWCVAFRNLFLRVGILDWIVGADKELSSVRERQISGAGAG